LQEHFDQVEIIEYLKVGLSKEEVESLLLLFSEEVSSLVRTGEEEYKSSPFDTRDRNQILKALCAKPKLLQRPIVIVEARAVIARPFEKLEDFLKE